MISLSAWQSEDEIHGEIFPYSCWSSGVYRPAFVEVPLAVLQIERLRKL